MNLMPIAWIWVVCVSVPIYTAQRNYDVSLFSRYTLDVAIRCDLSVLVEAYTSAIVDNIHSLQIVQHTSANNKENVLATLTMTNKTFAPSPFLNSSNRFFFVMAAGIENEEACLSVSISSVHVIPHNDLSYHCKVVYDPPVNDTAAANTTAIWRSRHFYFAATPVDVRYPGLHVQISQGLTLTCLVTSSDEDSSRHDTASIELELSNMHGDKTLVSRQLCPGSAPDTARVKCDRYEATQGGHLMVRQRAHSFQTTCADDGTYQCTLTTPSRQQSYQLQVSCSASSIADIASRIGFCLLIFVVGCLLTLIVTYAIFLIFYPSTRWFHRRRRDSYTIGYTLHVASSVADEKYLGYRRD
ncbi:uncharacterized protein [Littorina saxatilis]|uniref:Ig-like domain-containing protein n=1 Tax=Littorina saxatilis TaxID=31220 RepID=A0AAN9B622_9CAEN